MASKYDSVRNLQFINDASALLHPEVNNKLLKPLDEALRCRICFDYFNNCMITKCSHNYCSVCIRRYMTFKAQCPICFQDASEPELRNNRLIDEVLRTYIKIKEMLGEAVLPQSKSQSVHLAPVESISKKNVKESTMLNADEDKPEKNEENNIEDNEVSCPVCYKIVLKDRINIHLDTCLKRTEQYSERKTLPKLVYHLLSDKEIRKKLKEHGLNSTGDRQNLIRRHKNFLTLYNANCDSLTPKPVTELVLEIEKQEIEERSNSFPKPIKVHKKSDVSEIETEHKLYAKQHQSHFNALIQDLQQRHITHIKVEQEEEDDCEDIEETISSLEKYVAGAGTCLSSSDTQNPCQSNKSTDKVTFSADGNDSDVHFDRNSKQEPTPLKIIETKSLSKSKEKILDLPTFDNLPSSDDYETGKITQLNLLRKRKKGKQSSPMKK